MRTIKNLSENEIIEIAERRLDEAEQRAADHPMVRDLDLTPDEVERRARLAGIRNQWVRGELPPERRAALTAEEQEEVLGLECEREYDRMSEAWREQRLRASQVADEELERVDWQPLSSGSGVQAPGISIG